MRVTTHPAVVPGRGLRWHRWTERAIFEDGRLVEFQSIGEDFTEHHRMTEALREKEAHLSEAQRIAHLGSWTRNILTGELSWSEETYRIFGLSHEGVNIEEFMCCIHPEDLRRTGEAHRNAEKDGEQVNIEYRIMRPDGSVRHLYERSSGVHDENGRLVRLEGIVLDITERKRAEEALRRNEKLLRLIVEHCPDTIFIQDRNLRYVWVANPVNAVYKYKEEIIGKTDDDYPRVLNHEERRAAKRRVIVKGEPERCEVRFIESGLLFCYDATYIPYRDRKRDGCRSFGILTGYHRTKTDGRGRTPQRGTLSHRFRTGFRLCLLFQGGSGGSVGAGNG